MKRKTLLPVKILLDQETVVPLLPPTVCYNYNNLSRKKMYYVCLNICLAAKRRCCCNISPCFSCLLYKHVPLDGFSSALGSQGTLSSRNRRRRRKKRQARVLRPTPNHPEMAVLSGRQVEASCRICFIDFGLKLLRLLA